MVGAAAPFMAPKTRVMRRAPREAAIDADLARTGEPAEHQDIDLGTAFTRSWLAISTRPARNHGRESTEVGAPTR